MALQKPVCATLQREVRPAMTRNAGARSAQFFNGRQELGGVAAIGGAAGTRCPFPDLCAYTCNVSGGQMRALFRAAPTIVLVAFSTAIAYLAVVNYPVAQAQIEPPPS